MVQRNGMLGLVRFRMLREGISRYSTVRLDSRSTLCAARRAMPTSSIPQFRLLFAYLQEQNLPIERLTLVWVWKMAVETGGGEWMIGASWNCAIRMGCLWGRRCQWPRPPEFPSCRKLLFLQ